MLDKRIDFKGEFGISMRVENGEFTTTFAGVNGELSSEHIDKIKASSDFWINIYKELGKVEDENETDKYQDEQGCGIALDNLVYANKDYGIIVVPYNDKKSAYMELIGISADSRNLYMSTWNNSVVIEEGGRIWLDIISEQDLLFKQDAITYGEYIAIEVMRFKLVNLGKSPAGLVLSTLYNEQLRMNGIVPVDIITEEVISKSLEASHAYSKNFADDLNVTAQKATIAVAKDIIPGSDVKPKHGYLVSTVRYIDNKISVDLIGVGQLAFNANNFDFYVDGKVIDINTEYDFFIKK